MLHRSLFALLLCLFAAGYTLVGEAFAAVQANHVCMHQHASADGSGTDGMAANACAVHCAAGACVVSAIPDRQFIASVPRPVAAEAVRPPDGRSAPDTAPPKA